jgi:hypothetical protein
MASFSQKARVDGIAAEMDDIFPTRSGARICRSN